MDKNGLAKIGLAKVGHDRPFGVHPSGPHNGAPSPTSPLRGHTHSGFDLHPPLLAVLIVVVVVVGLDSAGPPSGGTAQHFALFFPFRSYSVSLAVFSWNFGGV